MVPPRTGEEARRLVELTPSRPDPSSKRRLLAAERLIASIEDELSDEDLTDDQKLQNIGERVCRYRDR